MESNSPDLLAVWEKLHTESRLSPERGKDFEALL